MIDSYQDWPDPMKVFINPNAMAKTCNVSMRAKEIEVGSQVIIPYHKVSGQAVADSVSERC